MRSVCIYSPKGGAGKTTITTHIADCLATVYGKRVLVFDADPQLSLYDSFITKTSNYNFDVTDSFPTSKPDYDYFIVDFRPASPILTSKKGLLREEIDKLERCDAIICPTKIARMDMRSAAAISQVNTKAPILTVLNTIDIQKNPSHARFVATRCESDERYSAVLYRPVYSNTIDEYSTIYTDKGVPQEGQSAAKQEIEAIVEALFNLIDPSYVVPKKHAALMPRLIARAKVAHKKHEKKRIELESKFKAEAKAINATKKESLEKLLARASELKCNLNSL
ncbi:MAG: AAA family ATPase [Shewanella sp.]